MSLLGSLPARRDGREEGRIAQAEILGRGLGARRAVNCSHSSPDGGVKCLTVAMQAPPLAAIAATPLTRSRSLTVSIVI